MHVIHNKYLCEMSPFIINVEYKYKGTSHVNNAFQFAMSIAR